MKFNTKFTLLGISIILLSSVLLALFIAFGIFLYSQSQQDNDTEDSNLLYISEDTGLLEQNPPVEEVKNDTTPPSKQGVIEKDTSRQILSVETTLSKAQIAEIEEEYSVEFTSDTPKNGVYVITTTDESNTTTLAKDLDATVETDIPVKMSADKVDWGIARIGADKVWDKSTGDGVKVAVIDTGVDLLHTDLSGNITAGYDFVNNDNSAMDDNGHGTHVAGIIASVQNGLGVIGGANKADIMPVKVLNNQGYGYLSDVAKGIYYAADNGARVINLSLGAPTDSLTLKAAVDYAVRKGVFIAAAAGNDGGQPCSYPAAYASVVCVVATDSYNKLASFSNVGGELAAPGVYNYSTYVGNLYKYMSGTSMSTPHVAASAAVVMSFCGDCTTTKVKDILHTTAVDLGAVGQDSIFGYGLVDLVAAIASISPTTVVTEPTTPTTTEPTTTPSSTNTGTVVAQNISITEPVTNTSNRYLPTTEEDITIKFSLEPISEDSTLQKITLSLSNEILFETTSQTDEYVIEKEKLDHSQNWVRVTAYFSNGKKSTDSIVLDLTKLKTTGRRQSTSNVLGISTFYDFSQFILGR